MRCACCHCAYACVCVCARSNRLWFCACHISAWKKNRYACFLGAFTKFRKAIISLVMSVRRSFSHVEQLCFHWGIFMWFCIWALFRKYVENIQLLLKSDKNNEYFTRRCFTFMKVSRWILPRMGNFLGKSLHKIKTFYVQCIFFQKSCRLWDNVEKYGKSGQTIDNIMRHMHFACWITKATHAETHTQNM